jgi:hypothetical protein
MDDAHDANMANTALDEAAALDDAIRKALSLVNVTVSARQASSSLNFATKMMLPIPLLTLGGVIRVPSIWTTLMGSKRIGFQFLTYTSLLLSRIKLDNYTTKNSVDNLAMKIPICIYIACRKLCVQSQSSDTSSIELEVIIAFNLS